MFDLAAWPWTMVVVIGTITVGLAIAWGMYRTSKISRRETKRTEEATRELYDREP